MKKILSGTLLLGLAITVQAQIPEDAIRYTWLPVSGTARMAAIGGAMGSLGGEISSAHMNPAGLGFYKNSEMVLTPSLKFGKLRADYRGTTTQNNKTNFMLGTSGVVFGKGYSDKFSSGSGAFAITINQTADFNRLEKYRGLNNYSSFSEMFAEEFAKSGLTIDEVLNVNSTFPYSSAPALYTYLIDTVRVGGILKVQGAPEPILNAGQALMQNMTKESSGGVYELALSGAINRNDKLYMGGSIGLPIVNYTSKTTFEESDTSNNTSNGFARFTYKDDFSTMGVGVNAKLGIIYRPVDYVRLGVAVHTPSVYMLTDERTTSITNILEPALPTPSVSSNLFTNNQPGEYKYIQRSAWRVIASGSYVFREVQDITKQKGFITADIEYQNHGGSKFKPDNEEPTDNDNAYYKALTEVVRNEYKGAFNFRVGGELKFTTIMGRLGFAYYGNPYRDAALKATRTILSGGLGYRNNGYFIDVTYAYNMGKNVDFPYRLEDRANTFANTKDRRGNIVATLGWKF